MMTNLAHYIGPSLLVMAATAAGRIIDEQSISISTVASVGMIVVLGTWRLSKQFQKIDDRLTSLEKTTDSLSCQRSDGKKHKSSCDESE